MVFLEDCAVLEGLVVNLRVVILTLELLLFGDLVPNLPDLVLVASVECRFAYLPVKLL